MTPLFSVVIPTYNRLSLLQKTLNSVERQSFQSWECLVCDDGSEDGTVDFLTELARRDVRFRLSRGLHGHMPAIPRNRGVREATGEWVAFLDDDDIWHEEKLAVQARIISATGADVVSVGTINFESTFDGFVQPGHANHQTRTVELTRVFLQKPPYPYISATAVRHRLLVEIGGFLEQGAYRAVEDFDLWLRLSASTATWVMECGTPLVAYRDQGSDSISSWNTPLKPDVIRQKWAMLECRLRTYVAQRHLLTREERWCLLQSMARNAADCRHRSIAVGWASAARLAWLLGLLFRLNAASSTPDSLFRGVRRLLTPSRAPRAERPSELQPILARVMVLVRLLLARRHIVMPPIPHWNESDGT